MFELATHDWRNGQPISNKDLDARIHLLQVEGARHLGYYPDDFIQNHPQLEAVRPAISSADYPYPER